MRREPAPEASILVGADEQLCAEARESLERRGFAVVPATTEKRLLARVAKERPHLVLLAFANMEGDGFALCRALTRDRSGDPLPVMVVADASIPSQVNDAYAAGATDLIPTPINWPLLGHRVRGLLRASRAYVELHRTRLSLETLQRIAGLGSWSWVVETGQMQWSAKVYSILGLEATREETTFEAFCCCMHPDDRSFTVEMIEAAVRTCRGFDVPMRVALPNGSVRHVQLRGEGSPDAKRVTGTMQDVTEERRAQEKIHYLAHYDSLTGLANRRRFLEHLEKAMQEARSRNTKLALLYMDLDQFKRINDTLGHGAGDELLRAVASALFDQVRSTDVVGRTRDAPGDSEISRLGGDEFAVLLTGIQSRADVERVARRILDTIPAPIVLESQEISATASIGVAIYPDDGEDVETLVKHADRAMYFAKESGRNHFAFFSDAMNSGALRRLSIEQHLRSALARNEMRLVYQPRIDVPSRKVASVEALLRWTHPELGPVPAKEFIPLAEESGLIVPIGEWVLRRACAQLREWREGGAGVDRVSVNVSTRQFRPNLARLVAEALRGADLRPTDLELEITESAMLQDDDMTASTLRDVRSMGVRIALDDFGTGYSSLSYLERFPLDTLKLDRSLVRDVPTSPSAVGIVQAVINMAHALGLRVVAEGVDARDQYDALAGLGCDEIQGFLLAAPLEPPDLLAYLGRGGR